MISCSSIAYSIEYMFKIYCKAQPRHVESCIEWKKKHMEQAIRRFPEAESAWLRPGIQLGELVMAEICAIHASHGGRVFFPGDSCGKMTFAKMVHHDIYLDWFSGNIAGNLFFSTKMFLQIVPSTNASTSLLPWHLCNTWVLWDLDGPCKSQYMANRRYKSVVFLHAWGV